jgi:hypothetical protein
VTKRYNFFYQKSKVYVVSLVISVVSKTGFGILLAHLISFKSEKKGMPGNFQVDDSISSEPGLNTYCLGLASFYFFKFF